MSCKSLSATLTLLLAARAASQQYELIKLYTPENFFDEFDFSTDQDLTEGFVQYESLANASALGLISNASETIYLGVDYTNVIPTTGLGRPSTRLQSKMTFTEGLFVIDLSHVPTGCGTWPAFWSAGLGDWPNDGEIDIIENVNDATVNNAALHAAGNCSVTASTAQTGSWKSTDCNIAHDGNQGCGTAFADPTSFGSAFNQNGGGVYAMEWTDSVINMWFFSPDNIPDSLWTDGSYLPRYSHPNTSDFGVPSASFAGPCSSTFGEKFFNHTLIFDTTFCGGWAGDSFGTSNSSQCPLTPGATPRQSCVNYVANNPAAFTEAYWEINSLRVWQKVPGLETPLYANKTSTPVVPVAPSVPVSPLTGGALTDPGKLPIQVLPASGATNSLPSIAPQVPDAGSALSGSVPGLPLNLPSTLMTVVPSIPIATPALPAVETPQAPGALPEVSPAAAPQNVGALAANAPTVPSLRREADDASIPSGVANAAAVPPPDVPLLVPDLPTIPVSPVTSSAFGLPSASLASSAPDLPPIPIIPSIPDDAGLVTALAPPSAPSITALSDVPDTAISTSLATSIEPLGDTPATPVVPALNTKDAQDAVGTLLDSMDDSTKGYLYQILSPIALEVLNNVDVPTDAENATQPVDSMPSPDVAETTLPIEPTAPTASVVQAVPSNPSVALSDDVSDSVLGKRDYTHWGPPTNGYGYDSDEDNVNTYNSNDGVDSDSYYDPYNEKDNYGDDYHSGSSDSDEDKSYGSHKSSYCKPNGAPSRPYGYYGEGKKDYDKTRQSVLPEKPPVGSVPWLQNFIEDYFRFKQLFEALSPTAKAKLAAVVDQLGRNESMKSFVVPAPTNTSAPASLPSNGFETRTVSRLLEDAFDAHMQIKRDFQSGTDHESKAKRAEGTTTNTSYNPKPDTSYKPDYSYKSNKAYSPSGPNPYKGSYPEAPFKKRNPWDPIFRRLGASDEHKLRSYIRLYNKLGGNMPEPGKDQGPYVSYITEWQHTWSTFSPEMQGDIISLLAKHVPVPPERTSKSKPHASYDPSYKPSNSYNRPSYSSPSPYKPSYGGPKYSEPSPFKPSYGEPNYSEPSPHKPSYGDNQPSYNKPSYSKPSYSSPSPYKPSYSSPAYEHSGPVKRVESAANSPTVKSSDSGLIDSDPSYYQVGSERPNSVSPNRNVPSNQYGAGNPADGQVPSASAPTAKAPSTLTVGPNVLTYNVPGLAKGVVKVGSASVDVQRDKPARPPVNPDNSSGVKSPGYRGGSSSQPPVALKYASSRAPVAKTSSIVRRPTQSPTSVRRSSSQVPVAKTSSIIRRPTPSPTSVRKSPSQVPVAKTSSIIRRPTPSPTPSKIPVAQSVRAKPAVPSPSTQVKSPSTAPPAKGSLADANPQYGATKFSVSGPSVKGSLSGYRPPRRDMQHGPAGEISKRDKYGLLPVNVTAIPANEAMAPLEPPDVPTDASPVGSLPSNNTDASKFDAALDLLSAQLADFFAQIFKPMPDIPSHGDETADSGDDAPFSTDVPPPSKDDVPIHGASDMPVPGGSIIPLSSVGGLPSPDTSSLPSLTVSKPPLPSVTGVSEPGSSDLPALDVGDLVQPPLAASPLLDMGDLSRPNFADLLLPHADDLPIPDTSDDPLSSADDVPLPHADELPIPDMSDEPLSSPDDTNVPGLDAFDIPSADISITHAHIVPTESKSSTSPFAGVWPETSHGD